MAKVSVSEIAETQTIVEAPTRVEPAGNGLWMTGVGVSLSLAVLGAALLLRNSRGFRGSAR
jgi:hypothetical protein